MTADRDVSASELSKNALSRDEYSSDESDVEGPSARLNNKITRPSWREGIRMWRWGIVTLILGVPFPPMFLGKYVPGLGRSRCASASLPISLSPRKRPPHRTGYGRDGHSSGGPVSSLQRVRRRCSLHLPVFLSSRFLPPTQGSPPFLTRDVNCEPVLIRTLMTGSPAIFMFVSRGL